MTEVQKENDQVPGRVREELCLPCTRKDKQIVAEVFCYDCDNFQCRECADIHKTFDVMKDHKMATAGEIPTKPVKFEMKGLDKCKTHGKIFKCLCNNHDKLCCSACAIINHRACHNVVEIKDVAHVSEETSMVLQPRLVIAKESCDSAVMHWKSNEISLRDSVKSLPQKINNIRAQMNEKFNKLLQDVEKDSTAFVKLQLIKGNENISKCDGLAMRFLTSLKFLDEVSIHGTPEQKFIAVHELNKQVKLAQKEVEHECDQLETVDISLKMNETSAPKDIIEDKNRLGALKIQTNKVTIDHVRGQRPVNLKLAKIIYLTKSENDKHEPLLNGVDFLPGGRLIAIDNMNDELLVFDDCLEKTGSIDLSYHPLSVVAVSEDTVAITSATGGNHQVELLYVSESSTLVNIKTYKVNGRYNSACLKDDNNLVIGTFDAIKLARILSLSGEEKDFSVNFHSKPYHPDTVSCTYIKELDKVIISDLDENLLYIYDVATNTRVIVRDSKIDGPTGVAVGPMNSVFVCCQNTNSVVQISPTGVILSSHMLDMRFPFSICISKDKTKLAVSNRRKEKRTLQVFKIN